MSIFSFFIDKDHNQNYTIVVLLIVKRSWRNGRRASLRGWWEKSRGGSSPLGRIIILLFKKLSLGE